MRNNLRKADENSLYQQEIKISICELKPEPPQLPAGSFISTFLHLTRDFAVLFFFLFFKMDSLFQTHHVPFCCGVKYIFSSSFTHKATAGEVSSHNIAKFAEKLEKNDVIVMTSCECTLAKLGVFVEILSSGTASVTFLTFSELSCSACAFDGFLHFPSAA